MANDLADVLLKPIKHYELERAEGGVTLDSFADWLSNNYLKKEEKEPHWENKDKGRSANSVINTSLVHLYRYAKLYAKAAIVDTCFSTPDDFIYLLNLVTVGQMTKSALIRLNVHEKSPGMQIVNRLIKNGLVEQNAMLTNKKSQMISITALGKARIDESMEKIKIASSLVTEPLSEEEKLQLIHLLQKLEVFHDSKLEKNLSSVTL